jgi:hypothetical protein
MVREEEDEAPSFDPEVPPMRAKPHHFAVNEPKGRSMSKSRRMRRNARGLTEDVLLSLLETEAASRGVPKNLVEVTPHLEDEAVRFGDSVMRSLEAAVEQYPTLDGAHYEDLYDDDGAYLVLMTLRGEGVGILDGNWDAHYSDSDVKKVAKFLQKDLEQWSNVTGSGIFDQALSDAVSEVAEDEDQQTAFAVTLQRTDSDDYGTVDGFVVLADTEAEVLEWLVEMIEDPSEDFWTAEAIEEGDTVERAEAYGTDPLKQMWYLSWAPSDQDADEEDEPESVTETLQIQEIKQFESEEDAVEHLDKRRVPVRQTFELGEDEE